MFWNKKKNQEENASVIEEESVSKKSNQTNEDEYIWVEGYKGTPDNMICENSYTELIYNNIVHRINKQEYELNKEVCLDDKEEPELCKKGFHFCLNLEDVFRYYFYDFSNRYFKVRAYVKKEDYDKVKDGKDNKLVAKKIILYEEIFPEYEIVKDCLQYTYSMKNNNTFEYQLTKDLFEDIKKSNLSFECYMDNYFYTEMIAIGYSSTFTNLLGNKYDHFIKKMYILTMAKAFKEEGVSTDMSVYMLLNDC